MPAKSLAWATGAAVPSRQLPGVDIAAEGMVGSDFAGGSEGSAGSRPSVCGRSRWGEPERACFRRDRHDGGNWAAPGSARGTGRVTPLSTNSAPSGEPGQGEQGRTAARNKRGQCQLARCQLRRHGQSLGRECRQSAGKDALRRRRPWRGDGRRGRFFRQGTRPHSPRRTIGMSRMNSLGSGFQFARFKPGQPERGQPDLG